jgi:hypothetical protein
MGYDTVYFGRSLVEIWEERTVSTPGSKNKLCKQAANSFNPEDGGSMFVGNIGKFLRDYMTPNLRRQYSP